MWDGSGAALIAALAAVIVELIREKRASREDRKLADEVRQLLREELSSCSEPSCPKQTGTSTTAATGAVSSNRSATSSCDDEARHEHTDQGEGQG